MHVCMRGLVIEYLSYVWIWARKFGSPRRFLVLVLSILYFIYGYSVKKISLPENRLRVYEHNSPMKRFMSTKYIVRQSNTVFSLVRLIMWLLRSNERIILLWCTIYFWALEPLPERFMFIHAQTIFDAATILDELWYGYIFYNDISI